MTQHFLSTGTKRLAEASHFDPVWGIGLPADDPEASNPRRWPGEHFARKGYFCRPLRLSNKRGQVGKPRPRLSILHSHFARRNS